MIQFLGIKTDDNGWMHFAWLARLNGVDISYKTGIGHCKIANSVDKAGVNKAGTAITFKVVK